MKRNLIGGAASAILVPLAIAGCSLQGQYSGDVNNSQNILPTALTAPASSSASPAASPTPTGGLTVPPVLSTVSPVPTTAVSSSPVVAGTPPSTEFPPRMDGIATPGFNVDSTGPDFAGYSGATESGRPFTAVSADLSVPTLPGLPASGYDDYAAWVGVESNDSRDLLQAGIGTGSYNGYEWDLWIYSVIGPTGQQWHLLLPVQSGDSLSISLWQIDGSSWEVRLADTTTGGLVTKSVTWESTANTAIWTVEAPPHGAGSALSSNLVPYSPAQSFSAVASLPQVSWVNESTLVQGGHILAQPSPLTGDDSFAVVYGPAAA